MRINWLFSDLQTLIYCWLPLQYILTSKVSNQIWSNAQ